MTPEPPFTWLADTSVRVSAIILLLMCLRPLLRRWLGSRASASLWLLVAVRLLLPWPVESPWGLPLPWPTPVLASHKPLGRTVSIKTSVTSGPHEEQLRPVMTAGALRSGSLSPAAWRLLGWDAWNIAWITGAALVMIRLVYGWWQVRRWIAGTVPGENDGRIQQVFDSIPEQYRRGIRLRTTDALEVPTLVGILHPQIWMPRTLLDRLSAEEIRHVLLHELGHAHRGDLLAQWVCSLACAVHWFNPLVWIMARLARTERELACDAWVLVRSNGEREAFAAEYGGTLIKVVTRLGVAAARRPWPATVAMAAGKRNLAVRVREIGAFRPVSLWRGRIALGAATALVAAFTVSRAAQTAEAPTPPPSSSPQADASLVATTPLPNDGSQAQITFKTKLIAFSKAAVAQLKEQQDKTPELAGLIRQLTASFDEKAAGAGNTPSVFSRVQVIPSGINQKFVQLMDDLPGVDLLSAPSVTTKSGQKATLALTRELIYPKAFEHNKPDSGRPALTPTDFEKVNLGFTVELEGSIPSGGEVVDVTVDSRFVEVEDWRSLENGKPIPADERHPYDDPKITQETINGQSVTVTSLPGGAQPVIGTQSVKTSSTVAPGSTLVVGGFYCAHGAWRSLGVEFSKALEGEAIIVSMITPTLVGAAGAITKTDPAHSTPQSINAPPVAADRPLPFGVPVKDKPGFITSPYAPDSGYVDVHGFTRGQEIRDPYTGKLFLVP